MRDGSVLEMSRRVAAPVPEEGVTVATSGGDHRPEARVAVAQVNVAQVNGLETAMPAIEALRLLNQTRVQLAEARDLLADSEQRAAEEHEFALRLQRAIMPSGVRLLATAGVDIAVRCLPARPGSLVAGDWYDALQLPGGDLLFVVGDIAGHGVEAVTGMVTARNALRGLAVTGADPGELIGQLNSMTCLFAEGVTGTVICGRYSPRSKILRWARAGHLPPVLVRDGTATVQPMPEGMLLGVQPDTEYKQLHLQLRREDTLLFYTDGLIERRAASISDALAEFAAAAVPVDPDLDTLASRILASAVSDTGDDACLLAVRIG
jgi:serine phosphatase RsbU (regulator of sigma subunit)